jgi:hypothetical protein
MIIVDSLSCLKFKSKFCRNNRIFISCKTKVLFPFRLPGLSTLEFVRVGNIGYSSGIYRILPERSKIVGPVEPGNQRNRSVIIRSYQADNVFIDFLPFLPGNRSKLSIVGSGLIKQFIECKCVITFEMLCNCSPEFICFLL